LRLASGPGYLLTARATRRLDDAAARIYRTGQEPWSAEFDLIVLDLPSSRVHRARVIASLAFLGYGRLGEATVWVAPRPADELATLLDESGLRYERFSATHAAGTKGAIALVERAWDLAEIGEAYRQFVADQRARLGRLGPASTDEQSYAARFQLVHAWRSFLFRDPQLPAPLLPADWPGQAAAESFDRWAARLRPAADRYVDHCLDQSSRTATRRPSPTGPGRTYPYPTRKGGPT
jgi:phenylacetic acid degradation operon negative regulatory protein